MEIRRAAVWLGVVLASCAAVLPAAAPRLDARAVVAIYPPWWGQRRALDAGATAGPVLPGAAPFAVLVLGSGAAVFGQLRRSGALVILNGEFGVCGAKTER